MHARTHTLPHTTTTHLEDLLQLVHVCLPLLMNLASCSLQGVQGGAEGGGGEAGACGVLIIWIHCVALLLYFSHYGATCGHTLVLPYFSSDTIVLP